MRKPPPSPVNAAATPTRTPEATEKEIIGTHEITPFRRAPQAPRGEARDEDPDRIPERADPL